MLKSGFQHEDDVYENYLQILISKEEKDIHSKSRTLGGANISAPKIWRKKYVNHDDKVLQQMCVNHENSFDFVLK